MHFEGNHKNVLNFSVCLEEPKEVNAPVDIEVVEETVKDNDGEIPKVLCRQMSRVSGNWVDTPDLGITCSVSSHCLEGDKFESRTNNVS